MRRVVDVCALCGSEKESTSTTAAQATSPLFCVTIGARNVGEVCGPCTTLLARRLSGPPGVASLDHMASCELLDFIMVKFIQLEAEPTAEHVREVSAAFDDVRVLLEKRHPILAETP